MKYAMTAVLVLGIFPVFAQSPTPPAAPASTVTPKKSVDDAPVKMALVVEENLQLKAQAINAQAQQAIAPLQQQFAEEEKIIDAWVEAVKKDNGWGADVTYNRNTKTFERATAPDKSTKETK